MLLKIFHHSVQSPVFFSFSKTADFRLSIAQYCSFALANSFAKSSRLNHSLAPIGSSNFPTAISHQWPEMTISTMRIENTVTVSKIGNQKI